MCCQGRCAPLENNPGKQMRLAVVQALQDSSSDVKARYSH